VKKYLLAAVVATTVAATPAFAQDTTGSTFTGPRVGVTAGFYNDSVLGFDEFSYGADVGYDFDAGGAVVGITAEIQDSKEITRELALTARAGAKVGTKGLVYVTGGYSNIRAYGINLDGFKAGVGGELAFGTNVYGKVEQLYSNYELGVDGWQTRIGVGFRF
jgi:outer membrane immunogenic protein